MRLLALAELATAVSKAGRSTIFFVTQCSTDVPGGLGFIGAGSDISTLEEQLQKTRDLLSDLPKPLPTAQDTLPIGVGFLIWGVQAHEVARIISNPGNRPAAIWLFAPRQFEDLAIWTKEIRQATDGATKVWVQVGTVAEAVGVVESAEPDVLVIQGQDAGGHGLTKGAGLVPLLPEAIEAVTNLCKDKSKRLPLFVAAGAIMTGACFAGALAMGAHGATLGTRYLAAEECNIPSGYQKAVLRAKDGGVTTVRSSVYDTLRGTTDWPAQYGGRGVINASFEDHEKGMSMEENKKLYEEAIKQGDEGWDESSGRMTTYAGSGVGLVKQVQPAADITNEVREDAVRILRETADRLSKAL